MYTHFEKNILKTEKTTEEDLDLSRLLQARVQKRWREEMSAEDRRALLAEKESKKRQRLESEVNPLPTPTPPSGPIDSSSEAVILPSLEEKRVIESRSVEAEPDNGTVASHTAPSLPDDESRKRRLLQRSATILVAPVETYVEENDRTRTTSSAFRLASMKSLGGAGGSKTGGAGGSVGHHYKETERRQSVRYGAGFVGHTCSMCGAFYSALATSALVATSVGSAAAIGAIDARRMCNCSSRHRGKFEQDPPTPPDYWDLSDDDWEDKIRR